MIVPVVFVLAVASIWSVLYVFGRRDWTNPKSWDFLIKGPTHLFKICADEEYRETMQVATSYKDRINILERTLKLAYIDRQQATQRLKKTEKYLERLVRSRKNARDIEQQMERLSAKHTALKEKICELCASIESQRLEIEKLKKQGVIEISKVSSNRAMRLTQRSIAEAERARDSIILPMERRIEAMEQQNLRAKAAIPTIVVTEQETLSVEATEKLERILQTVQRAASSYSNARSKLSVLTTSKIEHSFLRFAREIQNAEQQLQSSLDLESEIETDIAQLNVKIDWLKADIRLRQENPQQEQLEQNWDELLKTNCPTPLPEKESDPQQALLLSMEEGAAALTEVVRVLRSRNILLHQRLFRIEVFVERLNQIRHMVGLLPRSFNSELTECFRIASILLVFLQEQRIQDDTRIEETEEFARRIDKLEHSVQMTFIGLIKGKRPGDKPSQKKRKHFEKVLHSLQKTKRDQESEFRKWSAKSAEEQERNYNFLTALAVQRCRKHQELLEITSRNIDILKLMLHEKIDEKTAHT